MRKIVFIAVFSAFQLFAATDTKPSPVQTKTAKVAAKKPDITATITAADEKVLVLQYHEREIPVVHTKVHYTSVFVLPEKEVIMDANVGNTDLWTLNGAQGTNVAYVKPEKEGLETNLNLMTASGNVYSFLLKEGEQPNLKIIVHAEESGMVTAMASPPKWVMASDLDAAKRQVDAMRKEVADSKDASQEQIRVAGERSEESIAAFKSAFPAELKHEYVITGKHAQSFAIGGIAHTDTHTFIWANPQETPALYEMKDGKPSLINFEYANGVYAVPKVLDSGYLQIGKRKVEFKRQGE